jgi:hypothetical protein
VVLFLLAFDVLLYLLYGRAPCTPEVKTSPTVGADADGHDGHVHAMPDDALGQVAAIGIDAENVYHDADDRDDPALLTEGLKSFIVPNYFMSDNGVMVPSCSSCRLTVVARRRGRLLLADHPCDRRALPTVRASPR